MHQAVKHRVLCRKRWKTNEKQRQEPAITWKRKYWRCKRSLLSGWNVGTHSLGSFNIVFCSALQLLNSTTLFTLAQNKRIFRICDYALTDWFSLTNYWCETHGYSLLKAFIKVTNNLFTFQGEHIALLWVFSTNLRALWFRIELRTECTVDNILADAVFPQVNFRVAKGDNRFLEAGGRSRPSAVEAFPPKFFFWNLTFMKCLFRHFEIISLKQHLYLVFQSKRSHALFAIYISAKQQLRRYNMTKRSICDCLQNGVQRRTIGL